MLYLISIVGNFLLLVYAVVLIVGVGGGWLDRELWLHSNVAKIAQLLLIASAMGLLFANIRIIRNRYNGKSSFTHQWIICLDSVLYGTK